MVFKLSGMKSMVFLSEEHQSWFKMYLSTTDMHCKRARHIVVSATETCDCLLQPRLRAFSLLLQNL